MVSNFLVIFFINVTILMFSVASWGKAVGIAGFGVGEGVVVELVDAVVEVGHHFAYSVSDSCVLVDQNFLALVFEEIFDAGNVNLFAVFVLLFYLVDIQG